MKLTPGICQKCAFGHTEQAHRLRAEADQATEARHIHLANKLRNAARYHDEVAQAYLEVAKVPHAS